MFGGPGGTYIESRGTTISDEEDLIIEQTHV